MQIHLPRNPKRAECRIPIATATYIYPVHTTHNTHLFASQTRNYIFANTHSLQPSCLLSATSCDKIKADRTPAHAQNEFVSASTDAFRASVDPCFGLDPASAPASAPPAPASSLLSLATMLATARIWLTHVYGPARKNATQHNTQGKAKTTQLTNPVTG